MIKVLIHTYSGSHALSSDEFKYFSKIPRTLLSKGQRNYEHESKTF